MWREDSDEQSEELRYEVIATMDGAHLGSIGLSVFPSRPTIEARIVYGAAETKVFSGLEGEDKLSLIRIDRSAGDGEVTAAATKLTLRLTDDHVLVAEADGFNELNFNHHKSSASPLTRVRSRLTR